MKNDLDSQIQTRIEEFAKEMSELMRQAALESVREALGGGSASPAPKRGRPPGRKNNTTGTRKPAAKKTRKGKRGGKRTAAELQKLEDDFLKEVKKAGGRRVEEISKSMGVTTKDLALPVKKLMSDKKIKTTGQRRATRYFAR